VVGSFDGSRGGFDDVRNPQECGSTSRRGMKATVFGCVVDSGWLGGFGLSVDVPVLKPEGTPSDAGQYREVFNNWLTPVVFDRGCLDGVEVDLQIVEVSIPKILNDHKEPSSTKCAKNSLPFVINPSPTNPNWA
jgi:hypothetical protein